MYIEFLNNNNSVATFVSNENPTLKDFISSAMKSICRIQMQDNHVKRIIVFPKTRIIDTENEKLRYFTGNACKKIFCRYRKIKIRIRLNPRHSSNWPVSTQKKIRSSRNRNTIRRQTLVRSSIPGCLSFQSPNLVVFMAIYIARR